MVIEIEWIETQDGRRVPHATLPTRWLMDPGYEEAYKAFKEVLNALPEPDDAVITS